MNDRIDRLAKSLAEAGYDALLAQTSVTMGYLHDLHESGHERFMSLAVSPAGQVVLIAPALAETQARRVGIQDVRTWKDGEDPLALFEALADEWKLRSGILAVDDYMPARMLLEMQQTLPAALFKEGGSFVMGLMRRKEAAEIETMRKAGAMADESFAEVLPKIKVGLTELELGEMLQDAMRRRGGEPEFCIVAAGSGSAEPHHLSNSTKLAAGDVVILDFGCDYQGYKSDITRTVALGEPDPEADTVYRTVFAAHHAARKAAAYGATGQDVDRAARKVIEEAGYGQYFFHRTGHGIGMQVHEAPNMVEGNSDLLEEGNAFSIEPGIYLAGRFGVRIENIVTMGSEGCESLNAEPSAELIRASL